ncbi:MFS transporter [Nocardia sp. NPDC051787]|uniref:MFS transporter n=1 Tax=Nocardia sp. NPDC051787 TaxID=3155415 RepID=UPI00343EE1D0
MSGMPASAQMQVGMLLIVLGFLSAVRGCWPGRSTVPSSVRAVEFTTLDNTALRPAHVGLSIVLTLGMVIDTMKPATLGFVLPGLAAEYRISTAQASILPLVALTGTTIGSIAWGVLADRIGRRPTILLSGLLFVSTAICGAMPSFAWNLVMCLLMGASAGGFLPVAYSLLSEVMPASRRGLIVVLLTGLGTTGGYLVASGAAAAFEPHFGWRILWFLGLPTGLLLLLLNRWIPESPRFLAAHGQLSDAQQVMDRFGVKPLSTPESSTPPSHSGTERSSAVRATRLRWLFQAPYTGPTLAIVLYGLAWGLVNWGFITFLPIFLRGQADDLATGELLFLGALLAIPNTLLVAYLYGRWSSRRSMILYAVSTAVTLVGFAVLTTGSGTPRWLLTVLVAALLTSTGGMIAMLGPYAAEIYPTLLRGSGSGLAAAASKAAGMIAPPFVGTLAAIVTPRLIALLIAVPAAAAGIVFARTGRETAGQPLPEADLSAGVLGRVGELSPDGAPSAARE